MIGVSRFIMLAGVCVDLLLNVSISDLACLFKCTQLILSICSQIYLTAFFLYYLSSKSDLLHCFHLAMV